MSPLQVDAEGCKKCGNCVLICPERLFLQDAKGTVFGIAACDRAPRIAKLLELRGDRKIYGVWRAGIPTSDIETGSSENLLG